MRSKSGLKVACVPLILLAFAAFAATPVRAYGVAQWEVTFSFTCSVSPCAGFGFWGWCDFGSPTGDCQITNYNFNGALGIPAFTPFHINQDIHSCHIATGGFGLKGMPGFFADSGLVEFIGPGVPSVLPAQTPVNFVPLCAPPPQGAGLFFLCNTGIPAVAGHYTLSTINPFGIPPQPGIHYDIQVNQLPS